MKRNNPMAGQSGKIMSPRSSVWQYYELNRETRRATCRSCDKILAYTGGTTNLRYHLTAAHAMKEFEVIGPSAKVFKSAKSPKSPKRAPAKRSRKKAEIPQFMRSPIATASTSTVSTPSSSSATPGFLKSEPSAAASSELPPSLSSPAKHALQRRRMDSHFGNITDKLLQMIVMGLSPLNFVEGEGFQLFLKFMEPSYKIPDRNFFQSQIEILHEEGKLKLKEFLAKEAPSYSVVYDIWNGGDEETYTTIIVEFLSNEWIRESYVLGTERVSHIKVNASEMGECIRNLLLHYDLPPEGLVAIVNRQGMAKSQVGRVGAALLCESMSCAAEKLEHCVQAAFAIPEIKELIEQAGRMSMYLTSREVDRIIQEMGEAENLVADLELVENFRGNWISTSDMLFKLASTREIIDRIATLDAENSNNYFTSFQWELNETLVASLHILRAALTVLSKPKTGSVSCLLPVVHSILQHCEDAGFPPNSAMDKFVKVIGTETREKWDLTAILPSSVPMLAALLDPRFKKLKFIAEEDKVDVLDALKGVLASNENMNGGEDGALNSETNDASPFLCLFGGGEEYVQDKQGGDGEISSYIEFPALRHDSSPLEWWRVNKGRFPLLAKLARQFLSVPAVAQSAEDITSGLSTVDMKRALLETESASSLIFLNRNWSLIQV